MEAGKVRVVWMALFLLAVGQALADDGGGCNQPVSNGAE